ncbi:MAG: phosphotransferase family protein [Ilumatobacteraceae bacterium]
MQGIDVERVSAWLSDHVDGVVAPFEFELIVGGRSNLTYRVTDSADTRFVLRRPPTGHVLATAHDMAREHRIITAVGRTAVPVPETWALCTDNSVNGASFYVMQHVDGVVLDGPEQADLLPVDRRGATCEHLVDVLADLHAADVDEIGLGDLARREGYVERQIKRWSRQWADSKTRDLAAVDEVARHLARHIPTQHGVSIAHGDYRFGNCIVDPDEGRIAAILDWELCTLGDPLADLGYLGVYWVDASGEGRHNDPTSAPGFWSYDDVVQHYAARTGRDVSGIDYYVAFSSWRLAVISEGVYARYLHGAMGEQLVAEALEQFRSGTELLAEKALAAVRRMT